MAKRKNVECEDEADELITQTEAARMRGVTVAAISALVQRGRLQSVERFGKLLVFRREVLEFEREKPGRKRRSDDD